MSQNERFKRLKRMTVYFYPFEPSTLPFTSQTVSSLAKRSVIKMASWYQKVKLVLDSLLGKFCSQESTVRYFLGQKFFDSIQVQLNFTERDLYRCEIKHMSSLMNISCFQMALKLH